VTVGDSEAGRQRMQPEPAASRLMLMKNELRIVLALALAGCALDPATR
jgi:hypothetical protein